MVIDIWRRGKNIASERKTADDSIAAERTDEAEEFKRGDPSDAPEIYVERVRVAKEDRYVGRAPLGLSPWL